MPLNVLGPKGLTCTRQRKTATIQCKIKCPQSEHKVKESQGSVSNLGCCSAIG